MYKVDVQKYFISHESRLYEFMLQIDQEKGDEEIEEKIIHITPPSLIRYQNDYFCAFSLSSGGLSVPNLYIQSLSQEPNILDEDVIEVKGGEILIDFIPSKSRKGTGYLYYLSDAYFADNPNASRD